jgi:hypothetical protein
MSSFFSLEGIWFKEGQAPEWKYALESAENASWEELDDCDLDILGVQSVEECVDEEHVQDLLIEAVKTLQKAWAEGHPLALRYSRGPGHDVFFCAGGITRGDDPSEIFSAIRHINAAPFILEALEALE